MSLFFLIIALLVLIEFIVLNTLGLVLLISFLLLFISFFIFLFAFKRRKIVKEKQIKDFIKFHNLEKYQEGVLKGIDFFKKADKEIITIESFDHLKLRGYFIKNQNSCHKTMIICHGYQSTPYFDFSYAVKDYYDAGFDLLFIEQRAHEHSEGRFITFGMKERFDIKSWVEYAVNKNPENEIILAGVSMGASSIIFSLELGLPDHVKGLILDCGFSNAFDEIWWTISKKKKPLAKFLASIVNLYMKLFQKVSFKDVNIKDFLKENKIPVFIAHGTGDKVVPFEMAQEIYDNFDCDKTLFIVENAPHAQSYIFDPIGYKNKVTEFLNKILNK